MKYEIQIKMVDDLTHGNFYSPEERFKSAVDCTRQSIESILYDYPVVVKYNDKGSIVIDVNTSNLFTIDELEEKIKTSFCDNHGRKYKEFASVQIESEALE